jgi:nitric oxide reductase large subunit
VWHNRPGWLAATSIIVPITGSIKNKQRLTNRSLLFASYAAAGLTGGLAKIWLALQPHNHADLKAPAVFSNNEKIAD